MCISPNAHAESAYQRFCDIDVNPVGTNVGTHLLVPKSWYAAWTVTSLLSTQAQITLLSTPVSRGPCAPVSLPFCSFTRTYSGINVGTNQQVGTYSTKYQQRLVHNMCGETGGEWIEGMDGRDLLGGTWTDRAGVERE